MSLWVETEPNPTHVDHIDIIWTLSPVLLEFASIFLKLVKQIDYLSFRVVSADNHIVTKKLKHLSVEIHVCLCSFLCICILKCGQISSLQELVHKDICLWQVCSVASDWNQNVLKQGRLHDLDL